MGMNLLLVEDDEADRELTQRALTALGAQVACAESLAEAGDMLHRQVYDCVVLDWMLPDGRADRLLADVRRRLPDLPIVVVTGLDDQQLAESVLKGGAQDFIVKDSIGDNDLGRAVRYAVERQRAMVLQSRLAHADRLASVGQLAAGVAHEVNNPATVLMTNLTLMERIAHRHPHADRDGVALTELVRECNLAILRIASLTKQLGGFSRRTGGGPSWGNLTQLVEDGVRLAKPSMRHRATVDLRLQVVDPIVVDQVAMTGLVVNLLVNAQQAIDAAQQRDEHRIRVTVKPTPFGPRLIVEDSGDGVSPGTEEAIFTPFTSQSGGLGLGLAICREIAGGHGGTITAGQSDLGGAAFTVALPFDTGLQPRGPTTAVTLPRSLKVLLIDDEPRLRRSVSRLLGEHVVTEAGSAEHALEILSAADYVPDLVLCDIMMPNGSGADVYRQVLAERPDVASRFLFITGGAVTEEAHAFVETLPERVLYKPFSESELAVAIDALMKRNGGR